MDRYVSQDGMDFQYGTVQLDLEFTAGAAGAVPAVLTRSSGIASVTKSGNSYVVAFEDGYVGFCGGYGNIVQAVVSTAAAFGLKYIAPTTPNAAVPGNVAQVTLQPYAGTDGSAQSLVVNDILRFTFRFVRLAQPSGQ